MKIKKDKVRKLILICVIIISILFAIIYIIKISNNSRVARKLYGYNNMGVYKEPSIELEKNLEYINISVFSNFKGELPTSTMTKCIKDIFISEIPKVINEVQNLNEKTINTYYEENSRKIEDNLKIHTLEDFENLVDKFTKLDIDLQTDYKSCEFIQEQEHIKVEFTYENASKVTCYIEGNSTTNFELKF